MSLISGQHLVSRKHSSNSCLANSGRAEHTQWQSTASYTLRPHSLQEPVWTHVSLTECDPGQPSWEQGWGHTLCMAPSLAMNGDPLSRGRGDIRIMSVENPFQQCCKVLGWEGSSSESIQTVEGHASRKHQRKISRQVEQGVYVSCAHST